MGFPAFGDDNGEGSLGSDGGDDEDMSGEDGGHRLGNGANNIVTEGVRHDQSGVTSPATIRVGGASSFARSTTIMQRFMSALWRNFGSYILCWLWTFTVAFAPFFNSHKSFKHGWSKQARFTIDLFEGEEEVLVFDGIGNDIGDRMVVIGLKWS